MTEFGGGPEFGREDEPTTKEVLDRALAAGYIEQGDLGYFGDDLADVLTAVASYIEMAGEDAEEVFKRWGIAE